ncbi:hypothetical protein EMELA_v1c05120 [Mesoplasma melaleucae]|uniref:Uncharacterized protein n=1 Tax=Mesoplasma melaleucae TaxID=81459 RepID=A0A2K8NW42_9MOLU|nr:hypothetical protein [Mesoplasma melaleucae]ATZ18050.1 hypothetical protein EMELA_v1c05120 [Mesoplasma melaleucae]
MNLSAYLNEKDNEEKQHNLKLDKYNKEKEKLKNNIKLRKAHWIKQNIKSKKLSFFEQKLLDKKGKIQLIKTLCSLKQN